MIKIHNTLTREKEIFTEQEKGVVKFYCCGPTVYNYIHIGNARPICVCDVIRRYLEHEGFRVIYVQNFTDIDDKIINRASEEGTDYLAVSRKYIAEYKKDAKGLNIREATVHPLATENIEYILKIVSRLLDKGYAYMSDSGDVCFDVSKFKDYGKLSGQSMEDLKSGARVGVDGTKSDPLDFVLWKKAKAGEPFWNSPFGSGRPGWHIECSAMVYRYLGETIDIHFGGQDLIFPHHENEIAQSECYSGKTLANYWMHNGYINVDNRKMSKSLNNFFTVREVSEKYGYEVIRFFMLSSHYRNPLNYSNEVLDQCQSALGRLRTCRDNLEFLRKKFLNRESLETEGRLDCLMEYRKEFLKAMDDDFNTADAIAALFNLTKKINVIVADEGKINREFISGAISIFDELCEILGIVLAPKTGEVLREDLEGLINEREKARSEKNWELADALRDELKNKGVMLEDTTDGVKWSFLG